MEDRISLSTVYKTKHSTLEKIKVFWEPKDGDMVTDGESKFLLFQNRLLPLSNRDDLSFDKNLFFPLLSIAQIIDILCELYKGDKNIIPNLFYEDIDEFLVDYLWDELVSKIEFPERITYYREKLSNMLIDTFGSYINDGVCSELLFSHGFTHKKLMMKYGDEYEKIYRKLENDVEDVDHMWTIAWDEFDRRLGVTG